MVREAHKTDAGVGLEYGAGSSGDSKSSRSSKRKPETWTGTMLKAAMWVKPRREEPQLNHLDKESKGLDCGRRDGKVRFWRAVAAIQKDKVMEMRHELATVSTREWVALATDASGDTLFMHCVHNMSEACAQALFDDGYPLFLGFKGREAVLKRALDKVIHDRQCRHFKPGLVRLFRKIMHERKIQEGLEERPSLVRRLSQTLSDAGLLKLVAEKNKRTNGYDDDDRDDDDDSPDTVTPGDTPPPHKEKRRRRPSNERQGSSKSLASTATTATTASSSKRRKKKSFVKTAPKKVPPKPQRTSADFFDFIFCTTDESFLKDTPPKSAPPKTVSWEAIYDEQCDFESDVPHSDDDHRHDDSDIGCFNY